MWFNKQSEEKQREMNEMFQEYKKDFNIRIAKVTTEEITPVAEIELPPVEEYIEIPVYDFTEKEYLEYKRKRNENTLKRFGYKETHIRRLTEEQKKQQRELMEDLLYELRY